MDPDVAQLVREERLLEAAAMAAGRGDSHLASSLYERACAWSDAAAQALRDGDAARALELAAQGGDEGLAAKAIDLVPPAACEGIAVRLTQRAHDRWAARLLEAGGHFVASARSWERAGQATRAAELLERSGDPAGAARVLEGALRREPDAWTVATTLGALLVKFGKDAAAARVLQRVPSDAPQRGEALRHLAPALERLGLTRAAADAAAELTTRGLQETTGLLPPVAELRTRLFGRYDVVREIASSPSARVLECMDVVRGERVAVKVFAAWDMQGVGRDALARFEREVRTMRALDHPSIVPYRDYVAEGPAIVLAWMAGGTLERMLATTGPLAPARAAEIATGLLAALGEAHRLGIVHRDVKPANVLFDEAGGARLSDFGVAHLGDVSTTATAGVFGTIAYMSPEQRQGRPATARTDVFAVGTLLREMITGERPSPNETPRLRPSEAHRELRSEHDALVAHWTAADPTVRPTDAFEARTALAALAWPATVDTLGARHRTDRRPSAQPRAARLQVQEGGDLLDTWTGRHVERVLTTVGQCLVRARAFATADHEGLQTILRVEPGDSSVWLEAIVGRPLDRPLTAPERSRLVAALAALHGQGVTHGRIDSEHVVVGQSGVVLKFEPEQDASATIDLDRIALSRL